MRATLLVIAGSLALAGCGEDRPAGVGTPSSSETEEAPTRRPGEDAIRTRWESARAEVARLTAERETFLHEAVPEGEGRRVSLRRAAELETQLALAELTREEVELEFYANACPDAAREIAERHHAAATEERTARAAWLDARLARADADVALTDALDDERNDEAALAALEERADAARAHAEELAEPVEELGDRRADLVAEARAACAERLPSSGP